jgi:multiple sugar transport system ATP-binding protein
MRAEIARIQRDLGVTTIYVTHDQSEAMTLGDRVCVMRHGFLQQVDRPQVLYDRPANLFVASFIGSPAMNVVEAMLAEDGEGLAARFGPHSLRLDDAVVAERPALHGYVGRSLALGIRPEDIEDAELARDAPSDRRLRVTVDIREDMGSEVFLHFAIDAPPVKSDAVAEVVGAEALEAADAQTHHHGEPFVARVDRATRAREREPIELAIDTRRLHFFDLDTGEGVYGAAAEVERARPARAPAASNPA